MKYDALIDEIATLHARIVEGAARAVQRALLVRNWLTGARIVQFEQHGAERAKYGTALIPRLAADLKAAGIRGSSTDVLERMRSFYRSHPQLGPGAARTAGRAGGGAMNSRDFVRDATLGRLGRTGRPLQADVPGKNNLMER